METRVINERGEWQTRKQRIDARLRSVQPPWAIVRYHDRLDLSSLDCHAVEELPTANGPADYGLFVGGKLLGILEAKKVTVAPQNVLEQAKRYAAGALQGPGNWNGLRVPFLYATDLPHRGPDLPVAGENQLVVQLNEMVAA